MAKNPKILSIVLAGGEGTRLMPLTRDRAKPAVPFGGVFRLIDFPLSNLVNSDGKHRRADLQTVGTDLKFPVLLSVYLFGKRIPKAFVPCVVDRHSTYHASLLYGVNAKFLLQILWYPAGRLGLPPTAKVLPSDRHRSIDHSPEKIRNPVSSGFFQK